MQILINVLIFLVIFAILVGGLLLGKKYIFSKVRINKYIPLSIAVVILILGFFLGKYNQYLNVFSTVVAVLFFSWFWEINQLGEVTIKKEIKIKSKAKPNRVKNSKKDTPK